MTEAVICRYLLSYHNTPQTSTNLCPAELLYKRKLNARLKLLKPQSSQETLKEEESKVVFNESKDIKILYPGDQVWEEITSEGVNE